MLGITRTYSSQGFLNVLRHSAPYGEETDKYSAFDSDDSSSGEKSTHPVLKT